MNQSTNGNKHMYLLACKRYLKFFIREAFKIINPGTEFADNWHVSLVAEYLEAVTKGDIKRLIINIPPRALKSTCISICWPAWLLGNEPSRRIICSSYSQNLSNKLSLDCRHLMRSGFFGKVFPDVSILPGQNQKNKFVTNMMGFRLASSTSGTITGEGGNFLIVDDPHNAVDVNSAKKREKVIAWFQQSFSSRLDDKNNGVIIVVMQRLHVDDLTGFLLSNKTSNNWHLLKIPLMPLSKIIYKINNFVHIFKEGDLLHSERDVQNEIERMKGELGSQAFSAQYLQEPIVFDGGMVQKKWLKYYDEILKNDEYDHIIQSWDTAIKSGDENSFSVCTTWGKLHENFYLLNVFRARLEYPDLKKKVIYCATKWNPDLILIEDKASGQSLLQDLKRENNDLPLSSVKVKSDKVCRFARVTTLFESGRVFLKQDADWLDEYEKEILAFPYSKHSDQVDSTSQYMYYAIVNHTIIPRIHRL